MVDFAKGAVTAAQKNIMASIVVLVEEYFRLQDISHEHTRKTDEVINAWIKSQSIVSGRNGELAEDFYDLSDAQFDELRDDMHRVWFEAGLTDREGNTLSQFYTLDRERDICGKVKSLLETLSGEKITREIYSDDMEKLREIIRKCGA